MVPQTVVIVALLLRYAAFSFAQDEPPFTVVRPEPGDNLVLSSYDGANELYIEWTIAPGTEDDQVLITLQRGDNIDSLETIENVNGTAPNNGSFTWDGSDSISLASGDDPWLARTACNYTVRLSVDGLIAYSQYFTIINQDDGPVPDAATCPLERGVARPQLADGNANGTVLGTGQTANANSTSSGGANGSGDGGGGGISTATFAMAVVIPIVVLLIAFALLLWIGIRRGWFVKLGNRYARKDQNTHGITAGLGGGEQKEHPTSPTAAIVAEKRAEVREGGVEGNQPGELHGNYRPWETEAKEVQQLEGDERNARFAGGSTRGS